MNYFLNHRYKDKVKKNLQEIKQKKIKEPLVEGLRKKAGRPAKWSIEEIVAKFKDYIGSKEDLLADPSLLFNSQLKKKAKGDKNHWFWCAKYLYKRVDGLENCWYGKKDSIVYFLLQQTGWFDEQEAIRISIALEDISKKEWRNKIGKKAKSRMTDEEKRKQIGEKIRLKWKNDENYIKKTMEAIANKKNSKKNLTKQIHKDEKNNEQKNNQKYDEKIQSYFVKNFQKILVDIESIKNPIVKIDENYREWIISEKINKNIYRYKRLKPLIGVYLVYCQKYKKILTIKDLEEIDFELVFLIKKLYKNEFNVYNEIKDSIKALKKYFE